MTKKKDVAEKPKLTEKERIDNSANAISQILEKFQCALVVRPQFVPQQNGGYAIAGTVIVQAILDKKVDTK